ncbi:MAG: hypothetical protein WA709_15970 [Stellaceae bacterium]
MSRILAGLKAKNNDQTVGGRRAIQAPAWKIAENAGAKVSILVGKLIEQTDPNSCWYASFPRKPTRHR